MLEIVGMGQARELPCQIGSQCKDDRVRGRREGADGLVQLVDSQFLVPMADKCQISALECRHYINLDGFLLTKISTIILQMLDYRQSMFRFIWN